jgi:hypothetical protein
MILIRNPWGRNPWDLEPPMWYTQSMKPNVDQPWPILPLDWSPISQRWNANGGAFVRTLLNWTSTDSGTGKFWITLEDFLARYASIFICRIPSSFKTTLRDHWSFAGPNRNGGVLTGPTGHLNPQYTITVLHPVSLFVTLTQNSSNDISNLKYIMIALLPNHGIGMLKPLTQEDMEEKGFHFSGKPQRQQQVSMDIDLIHPGTYTVVVCTFDIGSECDFCLGVYSTSENSIEKLNRMDDE